MDRGNITAIIPKSWQSRFNHRPAGQGSAYPPFVPRFCHSASHRSFPRRQESREENGKASWFIIPRNHSKIMAITVQTPSSKAGQRIPPFVPHFCHSASHRSFPRRRESTEENGQASRQSFPNHGNHGSNTVQQGRGEHTLVAPRKGPRGKLHQINVQPPSNTSHSLSTPSRPLQPRFSHTPSPTHPGPSDFSCRNMPQLPLSLS